ncbi:MAG: hypothetical protein WCF04_07175 [Candidatus Nanopelagicales bacterium]
MPLGELVSRARSAAAVDPSSLYPTLGVKSHARGAFDSGVLQGAATAYKTLTQVREGWLVYPKLMAWEGALALVPDDLDGRWVTPEFISYIVKDDALSGEYLRHLISWPGFLEWVRVGSTGTNVRRRRLQPAAFEAIRVPLPSRPDQDRIAAHLSRIDRGGTSMSAHLGAMLNRLLARATAGVPRQPLGEVMRSSRQWLDVDVAASYRPIGVRGFGRGMIRYPEMPAESLSKLRYYTIEPGALIVSNIKAWEGAVCMAEPADAGRIASNRFLQYLPTSEAVATPWVEQYLLSTEGIASLAAASPGSADRNRTLSMAAFESMEIPVPEVRVQHAVVRIAHALRCVQAQQARRDRLAAAILPAARNQIFSVMR